MDSNDDNAIESKEEESDTNNTACSNETGLDQCPAGGKRLKKEDSETDIVPESDNPEEMGDSIPSGSCENKESENSNHGETNTLDSAISEPDCSSAHSEETSSSFRTSKKETSASSDISDGSDDESKTAEASSSSAGGCQKKTKTKCGKKKKSKNERTISDAKSKDDEEEDEEDEEEKNMRKYDPTPSTPRPVHQWSAPKAFLSRQIGAPCKYSPDLFRFKCNGSLHMVQRLELMYKMNKHDGCVNALNFNSLGTKLVTGSDDLDIIVWDWTTSEPILDYNSGHSSNVFQAKFLHNSGDLHVVTCARDGQVRIGELSSSGTCKGTRKLGQHRGAAHKLSLQKDNPSVFMSCSEDGQVYLFDVRADRRENPQKLLTSMENGKKVALYSLACNPQNSHEYVVGGRSPHVRVYDTRYNTEESACIKKFCPEHLVNREIRANVTSAVYNYNGEEILASYNEDIYLFNSHETESSKYLHRYRGHRNNQTIKGVNFFGSKSEYIVSGSDCGFIFFWDKESEHIVKYMYGDEMGVVNCIEPHPNMPVLATSGLDDDIKIWVPSCEYEPDLSGLRKHIINNMKEQEEDNNLPDMTALDNSILFFMQHISSARFQRRAAAGRGMDDSSNSSTEEDLDDDDDDSDLRPELQCTQS